MSDFIRDTDLNELVRQLNETSGRTEGQRLAPRRTVDESDPLRELLVEMIRKGATDLHLVAETPPVFRIDGVLHRSSVTMLDHETLTALFESYYSGLRQRLLAHGSADFSLVLGNADGDARSHRFRVNVHRERDRLGAAIRALPQRIPSLIELGLPREMEAIARLTRGLVLLCGPTGSGKSTTLAAIVDTINRSRAVHIVTIEDPIEYEHRNDKGLVKQIEIGRDSPSFGDALRASLRQDPDVILVGEMRDLETISTALMAAETGHLVLATLHTGDAEQGIHRVVDVFPPAQQGQIRHQLAVSLQAIVVQQLVPRIDGRGRALAAEILIATTPVRAHIRNDKLHNLGQELTLGRKQGMVPLEESLARLVRDGIIAREEAELRSRHVDDLNARMT